MSEHKGLTPDASWVDEVNGPLNAAGHRDWSPDCELPTEERRGGDGIDWNQSGCPACGQPTTEEMEQEAAQALEQADLPPLVQQAMSDLDTSGWVPGHVAADPEEREEESVPSLTPSADPLDPQEFGVHEIWVNPDGTMTIAVLAAPKPYVRIQPESGDALERSVMTWYLDDAAVLIWQQEPRHPLGITAGQTR